MHNDNEPVVRGRSDATIETPDSSGRDIFTISDLSKEFEITARALRFYEDQGLIAPQRKGMTRLYSRRDRGRLAWILRAKRVGFSLLEIREIIDLYDVGQSTQRLFTIRKCQERIALLQAQRIDIDSAIADLEYFVEEATKVQAEEDAKASKSL